MAAIRTAARRDEIIVVIAIGIGMSVVVVVVVAVVGAEWIFVETPIYGVSVVCLVAMRDTTGCGCPKRSGCPFPDSDVVESHRESAPANRLCRD